MIWKNWDLELTVAAFMESVANLILKQGLFCKLIFLILISILKTFAFSKERVLKGMKPIKIRFVKGANMESEETIASQRGWELPTFTKNRY